VPYARLVKCPFCGHLEDKVTDSRVASSGCEIRRRRECEGCQRRFTTYERIEDGLPVVVKKDGRREDFDRQKMLQGLLIACRKRPVSTERLETLVDTIVRELQDGTAREVTTADLGGRVITLLRVVDEIAYIRFASVYHSFRDVDEFVRELGTLVKSHPTG